MPNLQSEAYRQCQASRARIDAKLRRDAEEKMASATMLSPKSLRSPMRVRSTIQVSSLLDEARLGLELALGELSAPVQVTRIADTEEEERREEEESSAMARRRTNAALNLRQKNDAIEQSLADTEERLMLAVQRLVAQQESAYHSHGLGQASVAVAESNESVINQVHLLSEIEARQQSRLTLRHGSTVGAVRAAISSPSTDSNPAGDGDSFCEVAGDPLKATNIQEGPWWPVKSAATLGHWAAPGAGVRLHFGGE